MPGQSYQRPPVGSGAARDLEHLLAHGHEPSELEKLRARIDNVKRAVEPVGAADPSGAQPLRHRGS
jgi:hypothetical protein